MTDRPLFTPNAGLLSQAGVALRVLKLELLNDFELPHALASRLHGTTRDEIAAEVIALSAERSNTQ